MRKIYISKHAKARIFKRLRNIGIIESNIKKYIEVIVKYVRSIPDRYIGKPVKFKNFPWMYGLFDIVVVDDYFRDTRIVVTVIF